MASLHPDNMVVIKGFRIEISRPSGKEVDNAWETCTGGALNIEIVDSSIGADPAPVATPGHKFIEEIQLRGPMTSGRKWIAQDINDTVEGAPSRFDLTIVEINKDGSDGRRFTYHKCFLTRYVYPALSADGTGNLYEELSLKPERLTIK